MLTDGDTCCVVAFGDDPTRGAELVWDLTRNSRRPTWITLTLCDETICHELSDAEDLLAFVDAHLSDETKMERAL